MTTAQTEIARYWLLRECGKLDNQTPDVVLDIVRVALGMYASVEEAEADRAAVTAGMQERAAAYFATDEYKASVAGVAEALGI